MESVNELMLSGLPRTFMYPLMITNGAQIRKNSGKKKYIPTLWLDVCGWCRKGDTEYVMAESILPLPIDQRYDIETMKLLVNIIKELI